MDVSLRLLRYFDAAAEHRSVTAAARALRVSQPAISLAISQIEDILDVQLFVRQHARGMALTPAGTQIWREARKLLASADDFMAAVSGVGTSEQGVVQIGCLTYLAPRFLGGLLRGFRTLHPLIEVDVWEGDHQQLIGWLRDGKIEAALTYDLLLPERFHVTELLTLPPYVLVPARHRFVSRGAIHLREIIAEPCILLDLPISQDYYGSLFGSLGLRPNVRHRSKSIETVRSLVGNGLGYAILNQVAKTAKSNDGRSVRCLELLDELTPARVAAVHLADSRPRSVTTRFLEYCATQLFQSEALGQAATGAASSDANQQQLP